MVSVRAAKQRVMRTRIIARERDCSQSTLGNVRKSLLWLSTVQFEHFAGLGVSPQGFSALIQADNSPLQQFT